MSGTLYITGEHRRRRALNANATRAPHRHAARPAGADGVGVHAGRPPCSPGSVTSTPPGSRRWTRTSSSRSCSEKPAIHRFPALDGPSASTSCAASSSTDYDGDAEQIWKGVGRRRRAVSPAPARCPATATRRRRSSSRSWPSASRCSRRAGQAAAGVFADDTPRSVADIDSPASLAKVREWKKAQKAAKKDEQGRGRDT